MLNVLFMSIATKTGDSGTTALLFGKRVPKTHIRVATYGQVDELGSALGLCRAHTDNASAKAIIREIQGELVYLMSEIATDDADQARFHERYLKEAIQATAVERLTTQIAEKEAVSGSFKGWTYAGETVAQAFFDQARTTCRRTERALIALKETGANVRPELHQYLNRLADLLWLLGREHE
jgi:cob(I)alamin adenosyltransferase